MQLLLLSLLPYACTLHGFFFVSLPALRAKIRGSTVGTATVNGLDDRGAGVRVPIGVNNFHFSISSRPALGGPLRLLSNGHRQLFPGG
jgi:hypothetical protein